MKKEGQRTSPEEIKIVAIFTLIEKKSLQNSAVADATSRSSLYASYVQILLYPKEHQMHESLLCRKSFTCFSRMFLRKRTNCTFQSVKKPSKPVKKGIKLWTRVREFVYDTNIYSGRETKASDAMSVSTLAEQVVRKLAETLINTNVH